MTNMRRKLASKASGGTLSTSTALSGILTPQSDATGSSPGFSVPQGSFTFSETGRLAGTDDGLVRSIEADSSSAAHEDYVVAGALHGRAPSVALTPPSVAATESDAIATPSSSVSEFQGTVHSIDQTLKGLRISSPDSRLGMSGLASALSTSAGNSGINQTLSPSPAPSKASRATSRRRSSSNRNGQDKYNIRDEELPQDRYHDSSFQQALASARIALADLTSVLGSSSLHLEPESSMHRYHQRAKDLSRFQSPPTRTVGFVGDSGVGKSSLLNSLLDARGLARTSGEGRACTCVVTEYMFHEGNDFVAEVDTFSEDEMTAQLTTLFRNYRHFHRNKKAMESAERQSSEDEAKIALDTFQTCFQGTLADENYLKETNAQTVLQVINASVRDIVPTLQATTRQSASLEDFSNILMDLTSNSEAHREPSLWPFIRKIRVYLNAYVLSRGLILVDLPGLRDLNAARQSITERYLLECDEIFAVCEIGRAITDTAVMTVFDLARQAGLSNVGVVCTKSDLINADEMKKAWRGVPARRIQELQSDVARVREVKNTIDAELEGYLEDDDYSDDERRVRDDLYRRQRDTTKELKQLEFKLKQHVVETRNGIVTRDLEEQYGPIMPIHGVNVFCISNAAYWDNRNKPMEEALSHISLSGIPAVRKHCFSVVTESQTVIATRYIRGEIPALFQDIDLWVQSGAGTMDAERKRIVRETLDMIEARLKRDLTGTRSDFNDIAMSMRKEFEDRIMAWYEQRKQSWSDGAGAASDRWSTWWPSSYAVFCLHYGNHTTDNAGEHSWNEEALAVMSADLGPEWENLVSGIQTQHKKLTKLVEGCLVWAEQYLDTELGEEMDSASTLQEALKSRRDLLLYDMEDIYSELSDRLWTLRIDGLSGLRTSIIGRLTEASYDRANHQKGGGSDHKRKEIIGNKFKDVRLFIQLVSQFRKEFRQVAVDFQQIVQGALMRHLSVVRQTLSTLRDENVATESESDQAFRQRVQDGLRAASEVLERAQVQISRS